MFSMFESATLKLTGWYLLIIMVVSLLFSVLVYQSASSEVRTRLEQFGQSLPGDYFNPSYNSQDALFSISELQGNAAAHNILTSLIYINLVVFACGGVVSYLMAKRTLQPLREAHEAQTRFVSDASHELRTPLAVMKTELEVALRDPSLAESDMKLLLTSNLEEVDKLTKLSQTLLALSKQEYEKLAHKHVMFNALVHDVIDRYDSSGRITLNEKDKDITIDAHQPSIEELLTILVDNALKYSPSDSKVRISVSKRAGKAVFKIVNSGKGINAHDLPHIFDRFYRADNARTHGESSSFGLGLSLAKQIVELHDGELTVSSAPERETTFTAFLPSIKNTQAKLATPSR